MPKSKLLRAGLLACVLLAAQNKQVSDAEVKRVHSSALLIDTHNDITSRTVTGYDIGKNAGDGHTNLAGFRQGGVSAQFFAVYVAASYVNGNHAANRTLEMIDTVRHDIIDKYPNDFLFALTADDIEGAHRQGKIAALMGIEGGHAIEDSLRLLRDYYLLGIRYMTLTHSNTNNWADSSGDMDKAGVQHHNGLTDFGKDVVREMNRLGMMVDISHVADKTFWDALEVSTAPPFASHSSARSLSNVPRNMTDEMIGALAKKGGVVQINFACEFLSQATADASKSILPRLMAAREENNRALMEEYRKTVPPATLQDVVAHIDHVASWRDQRRRYRERLRRHHVRAYRTGRCIEISQPDPRVARERIFRRGHPEDLRGEFAARDAVGGSRGTTQERRLRNSEVRIGERRRSLPATGAWAMILRRQRYWF